jgi:hypothetical protein
MKTTIDMAREAGIRAETASGDAVIMTFEALKAFEALVRADERSVEREACAKVCEELAEKEWADNERCAAAIRARGNT